MTHSAGSRYHNRSTEIELWFENKHQRTNMAIITYNINNYYNDGFVYSQNHCPTVASASNTQPSQSVSVVYPGYIKEKLENRTEPSLCWSRKTPSVPQPPSQMSLHAHVGRSEGHPSHARCPQWSSERYRLLFDMVSTSTTRAFHFLSTVTRFNLCKFSLEVSLENVKNLTPSFIYNTLRDFTYSYWSSPRSRGAYRRHPHRGHPPRQLGCLHIHPPSAPSVCARANTEELAWRPMKPPSTLGQRGDIPSSCQTWPHSIISSRLYPSLTAKACASGFGTVITTLSSVIWNRWRHAQHLYRPISAATTVWTGN